jgi:aspartate/tyrosine/aromatic aminotransferase
VFRSVQPAPPDPILGLSELFRADDRQDKVDLTVGVYCDDHGRTPVFDAVRAAQQRHIDAEDTKTYLPIAGSAAFADGVSGLLFDADVGGDLAGRVRVAQTPGGTGALSVAARLTWVTSHRATVWLSQPTWPNHRPVFADADLPVTGYRYYDAATAELDPEAMLADLSAVRDGDAVVLHGCCHNPTGFDLDPGAWEELAQLLAERGALAIVDLAYAGLGDGLEPDTAPVRILTDAGVDLTVCLSFSKNMGLYGERVGAMVTIAATAELAEVVQSRVKACARSIYSNPPVHGGAIVSTILGDPELRASWLVELAAMRQRINSLRGLLAVELEAQGVDRCHRVADGRGMFALTGLSKDEVLRLREQHAVYLVENGRMNIAALTTESIPAFVAALGTI